MSARCVPLLPTGVRPPSAGVLEGVAYLFIVGVSRMTLRGFTSRANSSRPDFPVIRVVVALSGPVLGAPDLSSALFLWATTARTGDAVSSTGDLLIGLARQLIARSVWTAFTAFLTSACKTTGRVRRDVNPTRADAPLHTRRAAAASVQRRQ